MDVNGKSFTRVGRKGDGGYVMIDDLAALELGQSALASITEISWDLELAERGVQVLLYDPTVQNIPTQHPNIKFNQLGLGSSDTNDGAKRPLSDILEEEGIGNSGGMALKIDIEGDEWRALRDSPSEQLERFSQILLELHGMSDYSDHKNHINRMYVLKKLPDASGCASSRQQLGRNQGYRHDCHSGCDRGHSCFPENTTRFPLFTRTFPTSLDYPNNADRADILLTLPVSTRHSQ